MAAIRATSGFLMFVIALALTHVCLAENPQEPLVVVRNGKYGYIDHDGKIVIQPQFIWAGDFWQGLGSVYVCGRYASIDASGTLHPSRIALKGELERQERGGKFGFVDASGEFKIPPLFDNALPFSEGLAAVQEHDKWGFIDTDGDLVIRPQFEAAFYFHDGVGTVENESGVAIIDRVGKVLAGGFFLVDIVNEGRVPASLEDKSGFLDVEGKVVIPFIYDSVQPFSEGLAAVENGDKMGYIDRGGRVVIPFQFDKAREFGNGLAFVRLGKHNGFIDHTGKFAFVFSIDDAEADGFSAGSDIAMFWTGDRQFGYVNRSGRIIWGPTREPPDHPPLFGWTEEDKVESCEGFPESTRSAVTAFPDR